ncbi:HDOD domain-containing protein [Psychromonas ossibalaenae]|uniref:HDOD domain-containing protein n=1 Tax=Psychromonas ossibalaenae TaxID=444922 RepID=UPI00035C465C|nr:HDOD domain-containing protein [Psychromonas ossibalaenae]
MRENLSTAFYDAMFGETHLGTEMNKLEQKALHNVRDILNNREALSAQIPALPVVLLELIDVLKDENADFMAIAQVIEKDPSLAVEVLKVANSALYFRGERELTSLRKAVSLLGVAGVANITTTILVEKIRPAKPIYYRMFGRQIWCHSVQCAFLCKSIALENEIDEFDAYFLGLIHDIGKIIIFNCLCDALSTELPDDQPGSLVFKELMAEMSADISFFIAQEWQLPLLYCDALQSQRMKGDSRLAMVLYKGNLLSELYLMVKKGQLEQSLVIKILEKMAVSEYIWQDFLALAPKIETSVQ